MEVGFIKKLGVIGGMGSEATSYFYEQLVAHTKARIDQEHIDTIILNHASLPDRTNAILNNQTSSLLKSLIKNAQLLEEIGANNIAITCNTAHYFYDLMQDEVSVPVIHMPRETIQFALNEFADVKKIGVMATTGTLQAQVYDKECSRLGIDLIKPSKERQKDIMSLIYDDIKSGQKGDKEKFQRAYEELKAANCDVIILACTELSVYKKYNKVEIDCIDALDILVRESIIRSEAIYY